MADPYTLYSPKCCHKASAAEERCYPSLAEIRDQPSIRAALIVPVYVPWESFAAASNVES